MSVEKRIIVAPEDRERTAVVTIPLSAGGEIEIDTTWRFVGWLGDVKLKIKKQPNRVDVLPPEAFCGMAYPHGPHTDEASGDPCDGFAAQA